MPISTKFLVVPFQRNGKRLTVIEAREARNADAVDRLLENIAARYAGAAAYQMQVDTITGDVITSELLAKRGDVVDLLEEYM